MTKNTHLNLQQIYKNLDIIRSEILQMSLSELASDKMLRYSIEALRLRFDELNVLLEWSDNVRQRDTN
ncbi:hypothetical protein FFA43_01275 [Campylobacter hyointestinalis subsp. hyointestinalis]|uniref:hypothetical protein n=1 Tax=Campylobacter hyointestinalis TaxID=198 RepID=UPI000CE40598|nr:hypothetical protein [Campylobacter hyointestinalis]PPB57595.1 hypothetical protein CDQ71_06895 [Campylobacter hyointestinalis subsp. hyointestinalis]QCT99346.1 hypothetical protein FFA43_01275 [Campylobacter hyointestinalis subsp. hyointestinalis]